MGLRKIGILAGAFDPIHSGHINFIEKAAAEYGLDKVFILIEEKSKFKRSFVDFKHRKKIAELSIADKPKIELYPPQSVSFPLSSTLPKLKTEFKAKIYLLIGNDVKDHILMWPDSDKLLENVDLIIADRTEGDRYKQVSSGKVRDQIQAKTKKVDMEKTALDYCRQNSLYS